MNTPTCPRLRVDMPPFLSSPPTPTEIAAEKERIARQRLRRYHSDLAAKYRNAARRPWLPRPARPTAAGVNYRATRRITGQDGIGGQSRRAIGSGVKGIDPRAPSGSGNLAARGA